MGVSFAPGNATTSSIGIGAEGGTGMFPAVSGAVRAPQPPLHGRRAKPRVVQRRGDDSFRGTTGTWHERPAWAHQLVPHPSEVPRVERRGQRPPQGPDDKPMFTLQTQVNLRRPAEPRPYRQRQAQPTALPLSDTIVLSNLDKRKVRVAPPKCVQQAIESWGSVWNTPRAHKRQQMRIAALHNEMDAFDAKISAQAERAQTERAAADSDAGENSDAQPGGGGTNGAQTER